MTIPQHTPEPWHVTDYTAEPTGQPGIACAVWEVFPIPPGVLVNPHDAPRIVACINALAGIPDPAAAIQQAREALELILSEQTHEAWDKVRRALAALTPKGMTEGAIRLCGTIPPPPGPLYVGGSMQAALTPKREG